jgi:O-antigen ligase
MALAIVRAMTATHVPRRTAAPAPTHRYRLQVGEIWRYQNTQGASFWFLCIYLFFEYIRPQQLRPVLDILPWAQTSLILAYVAFVLEGGWFRVKSSATRWLIAFTAVVVLSIATAIYPKYAYANLNVYFVWVLVYFLMINVLVTERRFFVFLLSYLIYHFYMAFGAVRQWAFIGFRFRTWGLAGGAGWFNNSGDFGVALCVFLPLSLYFALALKPYLTKQRFRLVATMPILALLAIIGSSSRGAVVGALCVGVWMVLRTKYRFKALASATAVVILGYLILPAQQKARFSSAGSDNTSVSRLTYWKNGLEIARDHPLTGIGYYGWLPYNADHYPRRREIDGYPLKPELPHNMFVLAVAELGYPGLLLLLTLMGMTFRINSRTRRLAAHEPESGRVYFLLARGLDGSLIGLAVSGFFDTVLWYPFFWVQLALTVALHEVLRRKIAARSAFVAAPRGNNARLRAR